MRQIITFGCLFCTAMLAMPAQPSDLAREKRMAEEIVDAILDGEAIELKAGDTKFLGILTETEAERPRGGIVILHGRGYHPDWPNVAQPLRTALVQDGWHTLSLQMPVLHKAATYFDYLPVLHEAHPRIEAGIAYLRQQGVENIVLVAHSCSVHMSMDWIEKNGDQSIDAYIGIGMGATDYRQPMQRPFPLDRMRVPVLDLYGGNDYPAVHRLAPQRRAMLQHPASRQILVPDADHYFSNRDKPLVEAVRTWLAGLRL